VPILVVPDPSLVVLVGAAGSGKSTLAARLFAADEIVSSDALRAVVSGDEADQRATTVAFRILHRMVDQRIAAGSLTVVDATNTTRIARLPLVRRARAAGLPLVAIVLYLPDDAVHAQNAARSRVVARAIVDRHLAAVRRSVDRAELSDEGFDKVVVLATSRDAAALSIDRRRRGSSGSP
jgi:protein phosphatase